LCLAYDKCYSFFSYAAVLFYFGGVYKDYKIKEYFFKKVRGLYIPFLKYEFLFLFLHNIFVKFYIYSKDLYIGSAKDYLNRLVHIILFDNTEPLLTPMWFITVLFLTSMLYRFIDAFCKNNLILKLCICTACFIFGNIFTTKHWLFIERSYYNQNVINVTLSAVFFFCLGDLFYKHCEKYISDFIKKQQAGKKTVIIWGCILLCIFVNVLSRSMGVSGEMRLNTYSSYTLFLICALAGIAMVYLFSYWSVLKFNKLTNCICYLGRKSYMIMAFHQLCYKIIIVFYIILEQDSAWTLLSVLEFYDIPSFLYRIAALFAGILITIGIAETSAKIVKMYDKAKNMWRKK